MEGDSVYGVCWYLLPLGFLVLVWTGLCRLARRQEARVKVTPSSMSQAFGLGYLAASVAVQDARDEGRLLEEARRLLGSAELSKDELVGMGQELAEREEAASWKRRVAGVLDLAHLAWLLAIVGIVITAVPFWIIAIVPLYHAWIAPHLDFEVASELGAWVLACVLIVSASSNSSRSSPSPSAAVASGPAFSGFSTSSTPPSFAASSSSTSSLPLVAPSVTGQGGRSGSGSYMALLGVAVAAVAMIGTLGMHTPPFGVERDSVWPWYMVLVSAPLAVRHQSRLLGFLTVTLLQQALGFGLECRGLLWVVGFNSGVAMMHAMDASLFLVVTFLAVRTLSRSWGPSPRFDALLGPFVDAVLTLAPVCHFVGCLIISSAFYFDYTRPSTADLYWGTQAYVILMLAAAIAVGSLASLGALRNTGLTFACLYAGEKATEISLSHLAPYQITLLFAAFLALYAFASHLVRSLRSKTKVQ